MQTLDDFVGMLDVDNIIKVVEFLQVREKDVVDDVERVDGLQVVVVLTFVELPHVGF